MWLRVLVLVLWVLVLWVLMLVWVLVRVWSVVGSVCHVWAKAIAVEHRR